MKQIIPLVGKGLFLLLFPLSFAVSKGLNDTISTVLLDNFENLSLWEKVKSDGVDIEISNEPGIDDKCIRIDFNFKLGSGYCGIKKELNLTLPDNYQFTFYIKGNASPNNLEFKLIDSTGENVWWLNQRNFEFNSNWEKITIKKRYISFAWGPAGGGEIKKIGFIEIIISSSTGGSGTVYIDKLELEKIEPDSIRQKISEFEISSSSGEIYNAIDHNPLTFWESEEEKPYIAIDLKSVKEYGGLVINWSEEHYADKYKILTSMDSSEWNEVYSVKNGTGGKNYIFLKDCESRFIKIQLLNSHTGRYKIYEISIKDPSFSSSINEFFKYIAGDFPEGYFPKYFRGKQTYWTVIGLPYDKKEALVSEDGVIEVDKSGFTIEPFLLINGKFYTYNDASITQSLEEEYLPIPVVNWQIGSIKLEIKSFVSGSDDSSFIMVRYKLENTSKKAIAGDLFITIRPFQILPPWQQLNIIGGATKIKEISYSDQIIKVDDKKIILKSTPDDVGFSEFEHGEIIKHLSIGILPEKKNVRCDFGYASGAIKYRFTLKDKATKSFYLIIPLHGNQNLLHLKDKNFDEELSKVKNLWKDLLNLKTSNEKIVLRVPDQKLVNTLKSNLAYIFINADKPKNNQKEISLQPGSRTYERSWIRDGSLISNSLLYFGFYEIVRQYIEWYSKYQYENGKIPCVVDSRGPDPVPEHDSNGEFIYLLANYFKFTKDTSLLQNKFETVKKAVDYISYLTSLRKTAEFKFEDKRAYYGLLTESISHEGYSAKP
ncbi:MAG: discoidin domain-containing protein, partial [Candidatus Kryptonium sp.]